MKPSGIKRLARALRMVLTHLGGPVEGDIGVILPLRLKKALRQDEEAAALLKDALAGLCTGEVRCGHWGRDDRGTNGFCGVRLLLTICDPWPNIRSATDDAATLGLEADEYICNQALANLVQAHGRSRDPWEGEPVVHVHVGRLLPPVDCFEGAEILRLPRGRPRADGSSDRPVAAGSASPPGQGEKCL